MVAAFLAVATVFFAVITNFREESPPLRPTVLVGEASPSIGHGVLSVCACGRREYRDDVNDGEKKVSALALKVGIHTTRRRVIRVCSFHGWVAARGWVGGRWGLSV